MRSEGQKGHDGTYKLPIKGEIGLISGVARNLRQGVCTVVLPLPSFPFPSPPSTFPPFRLPLPSSFPLPPSSP